MTLKPGDLIDLTLTSYAQAVLSNNEKYDADYKAYRKELERRLDLIPPPQDGAEHGSLLELFWAKAFNIEEDGNRRAVVSLGDALEITAALRARVSMVTADDEHLRAEIERLSKEVGAQADLLERREQRIRELTQHIYNNPTQ